MATEQIIEITIGKDGDVKIEPVAGFKDGACMKETLDLEKALGGNITNRVKKAEAYIPPQTTKSTAKVGK
jgi:hypothetical protein